MTQPDVPTSPGPAKAVWSMSPAKIAKYLTALLGAAALAVSQGLIEGTAAKWVAVIIGVATAMGVYVVPNKKT